MKEIMISEQDKQYTKREISMAMLKKNTEASKKQKHQRELQWL